MTGLPNSPSTGLSPGLPTGLATRAGAGPAPTGLRRFTTPRPPREERCELCGTRLADGRHRHLADTDQRSLVCACGPCAQLMDRSTGPSTGPSTSPSTDPSTFPRGRFRAVPDRFLADPAHRVDDTVWEALRIPVSVAFLFRNSALGRAVALYPSPAGATESELEDPAWQSVRDATRLAAGLEPDVEALLLRRHGGRTECFLVPIDVCYELVGRMRLHWRGFDGGAEARSDLDAVFARVRGRARDERTCDVQARDEWVRDERGSRP
ncbi:hypothetical protein SLA_0383 [Streptomyces laurentii]|uniref:Uncharacterized protein n=1 Tax=Streptomyces laurentii TaxID=39478 RepID=A0A161JG89_STRLU|nr:hypothetical protein SLA_0383 [Streptomyces laurentii]